VALANPSDTNAVLAAANTAISSFHGVFTAAEIGCTTRWRAAFASGNSHYTGSLPVIPTDHPAIDRLYYKSVLSVICTERTNHILLGHVERPDRHQHRAELRRALRRQQVYSGAESEVFVGTITSAWRMLQASASLTMITSLNSRLLRNSHRSREPVSHT